MAAEDVEHHQQLQLQLAPQVQQQALDQQFILHERRQQLDPQLPRDGKGNGNGSNGNVTEEGDVMEDGDVVELRASSFGNKVLASLPMAASKQQQQQQSRPKKQSNGRKSSTSTSSVSPRTTTTAAASTPHTKKGLRRQSHHKRLPKACHQPDQTDYLASSTSTPRRLPQRQAAAASRARYDLEAAWTPLEEYLAVSSDDDDDDDEDEDEHSSDPIVDADEGEGGRSKGVRASVGGVAPRGDRSRPGETRKRKLGLMKSRRRRQQELSSASSESDESDAYKYEPDEDDKMQSSRRKKIKRKPRNTSVIKLTTMDDPTRKLRRCVDESGLSRYHIRYLMDFIWKSTDWNAAARFVYQAVGGPAFGGQRSASAYPPDTHDIQTIVEELGYPSLLASHWGIHLKESLCGVYPQWSSG